MRFTKMHGAGNDYVYVDLFREEVPDPESLARAISDRHKGVGSDGLILIAPAEGADGRMIMYNADGSRGKMCGNGIRCVAKYLYDHGYARSAVLRIETDSGPRDVEVEAENGRVVRARVDMGRPRFERSAIPMTGGPGRAWGEPLDLEEGSVEVYALSLGNPHCVVFVDDPEEYPVETVGPQLERHAAFPERANVEFVAVENPHRMVQRTWERGSGETLACGSGATAAAIVAIERRLAEPPVVVRLRGGDLEIDYRPGGVPFLRGEAVEVFRGEWPD